MFSNPLDRRLVLIQSNFPPTQVPFSFCTKKQAYAPGVVSASPQEARVAPVQL